MSKIFGVVIGVVKQVGDPNHQGAVKVEYPWLKGRTLSRWARIAAPMAGKDRGVWLVPEVGDEAVLAFDRGDPHEPYVLGFVWNGVDVPHTTHVRERVIRSFNGHTIRFLDSTPTPGGNKGGIAIEDASGNQIVMTNGKVTIRSKGVLELDAPTVILGGTTPKSIFRRVVTPNRNPI